MDAHVHMIISGIVQGVGFRYFVMQQARRMKLTGWVKNLPTGEVEIDVEGPRGLIDSLIQNIRVGNEWCRVKDIQIQWKKITNQYSGFDITY